MLQTLILPLLLASAPEGWYIQKANDPYYWSSPGEVAAMDKERFDMDVQICDQSGRVYSTLSKPTKKQLFAALAWAKSGTVDALDEVNRQRTQYGLRPYLRDEGLMEAARKCSAFRAARRIQGHCENDFAFVPSGCSANCAGCAAWASGFGACNILGSQQYCGAAYTIGADGLRYCHAFYR